MQPGADGALYYGFGVAGDSAYCREGYKVQIIVYKLFSKSRITFLER